MKYEYTNQSATIFPGFYDSVLYNPDMESDAATQKADDTDTEYEIKDWQGYTNTIAKECTDWLFSHLPRHDIIKSMEYKELWSPHEYNFLTDKLTIDCDIDLDGLKNYCLQANRDEFGQYLYDNWSSRPGFISFIDNNIVEFEQNPDTTIMVEFYLLRELDLLSDNDDNEYEYYCWELANDTMWQYLEPTTQGE